MNWGFEPSLVCGLLHPIGHEKKFEKLVHNKCGMRLRKLSFYDLGIQLDDKNYNNAINYLKPFLSGILPRGIDTLPFKKFIQKRLNTQGLSFMGPIYNKFPYEPNHPLTHCGFAPLLLDKRYSGKFHNGVKIYNEEQEANLKRLVNFESKGYKPKVNGKPTDADLILKSEDLK